MKTYNIRIVGCDESTHVTMNLTTKELEVITRLADRADEISSCVCEPTIEIEEKK